MVWVFIVLGFTATLLLFRWVFRRGEEHWSFMQDQHGRGRGGVPPVDGKLPDVFRPGH